MHCAPPEKVLQPHRRHQNINPVLINQGKPAQTVPIPPSPLHDRPTPPLYNDCSPYSPRSHPMRPTPSSYLAWFAHISFGEPTVRTGRRPALLPISHLLRSPSSFPKQLLLYQSSPADRFTACLSLMLPVNLLVFDFILVDFTLQLATVLRYQRDDYSSVHRNAVTRRILPL